MSQRAGVAGRSMLVAGGLMGLAAGVLGYAVTRWIVTPPSPERANGRLPDGHASESLEAGTAAMDTGDEGAGARRRGADERMARERAAPLRKLHAGAAALAWSVLADSGMEHYRGGFHNGLMYLAPAVAATELAISAAAVGGWRGGRIAGATHFAAIGTGLVGSGFHVYNVGKRTGGWRWVNLFYGAPLAAPMGLVFAGALGLTAECISRVLVAEHPAREPSQGHVAHELEAEHAAGGLVAAQFTWESASGGNRRSPTKLLALATAAGLGGTSAEAGLLHFRGAFHDRYMLLPVVLPPLAAVAVALEALSSGGVRRSGARGSVSRRSGLTRSLLRLSQGLGFAGVGFHAFGVGRGMGGWRNWSQNLLEGPPLPAPPSFTGMALAAEAALELNEMEVRSATSHTVRHGRTTGGVR